MRTRSSSNLVGNSSSNPTTTNPKRRNRRRSKQPFSLEESPIVTMADQRTMAELLRAPTEGYAEAIVVPPILAEHFELNYSLINMMTSDQFCRLEKDNPHDHIRWFNKITSIIKYKDVPNSGMGPLQRFSFVALSSSWVSPNCNQLDTFPQMALTRSNPRFLNSAADGNLLEKTDSRFKLTHAVNQQTSDVTTAMTAILKQFQATPPPVSVKAVEEICVTCGGAHPYY
ncbi:hypothetical protein Tco_1025254 [Tanacetum coccineum]